MTSAIAQARFNEFNQQYFTGKLPQYRVEVVENLGVSIAGSIDKSTRCITLARRAPQGMDAILLHEMAHAATNIHRGKKWQAEMQRLSSMRSPVAVEDLTPGPPPKKLLGILASSWVADNPEATVEQFDRYLLTQTPFKERPKGTKRSLLQQYPQLLPRVFREAKERILAFQQGLSQYETEGE